MTPAMITTANAVPPELREAIRNAAHWYAQRRAGNVDEREFSQWLDASPHNRRAWREIETVQSQLERAGPLASSLLQGNETSRRELLRRLAVLAAITPVTWFAWRTVDQQSWRRTADYRTGIGERRQFALTDGSALILDTDSAADVEFSSSQRLVHLRSGAIYIATARDTATIARPFFVATAHGRVQALGTRFTVRSDDAGTTVAVQQDAVRIFAAASLQSVDIRAGQQLTFSADAAGELRRAEISAGSWVDGSLVVVDMPLAQLLDELARYRPGLLGCDPAVAGLKISGAFPLSDIDRALLVLTESFPLRLQQRTRYWVRVMPV